MTNVEAKQLLEYLSNQGYDNGTVKDLEWLMEGQGYDLSDDGDSDAKAVVKAREALTQR